MSVLAHCDIHRWRAGQKPAATRREEGSKPGIHNGIARSKLSGPGPAPGKPAKQTSARGPAWRFPAEEQFVINLINLIRMQLVANHGLTGAAVAFNESFQCERKNFFSVGKKLSAFPTIGRSAVVICTATRMNTITQVYKPADVRAL